jgi:putative phage-type endonuclease
MYRNLVQFVPRLITLLLVLSCEAFLNFLHHKEISPNCQWFTIQTEPSTATHTEPSATSLPVMKGSVLSYQQAPDALYIVNHPGIDFPSLPARNVMCPIPIVLPECQTTQLQKLQVTTEQVTAFEESTRLQADSSLWHRLRQSRLTASKIGTICKRRADFHKLRDQLQRSIRASSAMKKGLLREPFAAEMYATVMDNRVSLYPCGLVISPYSPWIAASPDRRVFCCDRTPPFGLLEIKCPQSTDLASVTCLTANDTKDGLKLKVSHDYYYQVQCQLAVTGLEWCDFMVYLENGELHLETISFDCEFWRVAQSKVDTFFFNFFI